MNRRHRNEEIPGLIEAIRKAGYGWVLELAGAVAVIVLLVGFYFFVQHTTISGLQPLFDQTAPHP